MANGECSNGDGKPGDTYVTYRVEADIDGRGVGFCLADAVRTSLSSKNIAGTVVQEKINGKRASVLVSLKINGIEDFNVRNIRTHLVVTGKFDTTEKSKPQNLKITPIPSGTTLQYNDPSQADKTLESYQKAIETKTEELTRKDNAIATLQDAILDKEYRIATLENRASLPTSSSRRQSSSALESILSGFAESSLDDVIDASIDYQDLGHLQKIFEKNRNMSYAEYVNLTLGTEFKDEKEIEALSIEVKKIGSWKSLPESKDYDKKYESHMRDKRFVESINNKENDTEMSYEMALSLRATFAATQKDMERARTARDAAKKEFERKNAIAQRIPLLYTDYSLLSEISRRASERSVGFNVVASLGDVSNKVYIPEVQILSERLQKYIIGIIPGFQNSFAEGPFRVLEFKPESRKAAYASFADKRTEIENNPLLNALGIRPSLVVLG